MARDGRSPSTGDCRRGPSAPSSDKRPPVLFAGRTTADTPEAADEIFAAIAPSGPARDPGRADHPAFFAPRTGAVSKCAIPGAWSRRSAARPRALTSKLATRSFFRMTNSVEFRRGTFLALRVEWRPFRSCRIRRLGKKSELEPHRQAVRSGAVPARPRTMRDDPADRGAHARHAAE